MVELGGLFYFPLLDTLWRSDGTTEGTEAVLAIDKLCPSCELSVFGDLVRIKERLYFFIADSDFHYLWRSDGSATTSKATSSATASSPVTRRLGRSRDLPRIEGSGGSLSIHPGNLAHM